MVACTRKLKTTATGLFNFSEWVSSKARRDFQVAVGHATLNGYLRSIKADVQADAQQPENLRWENGIATKHALAEGQQCDCTGKSFHMEQSLAFGLTTFCGSPRRRHAPGGGARKRLYVYWLYCPLLTGCCWKSRDENIWALMSRRTIALEAWIQFSLGRLFILGDLLIFLWWLGFYDQRELKMVAKSLTSQWVK